MTVPTKSPIAASGLAARPLRDASHLLRGRDVDHGGGDRGADVLRGGAIEQRRVVGEHGRRRAAPVAVGRQARGDLRDRGLGLLARHGVEAADVVEAEARVERGAQVIAARDGDDLAARGGRGGGRGVRHERRGEELEHEGVPAKAARLERRDDALELGVVVHARRRVGVRAQLLGPGLGEERVAREGRALRPRPRVATGVTTPPKAKRPFCAAKTVVLLGVVVPGEGRREDRPQRVELLRGRRCRLPDRVRGVEARRRRRDREVRAVDLGAERDDEGLVHRDAHLVAGVRLPVREERRRAEEAGARRGEHELLGGRGSAGRS